jgi:hypothetical protein
MFNVYYKPGIVLNFGLLNYVAGMRIRALMVVNAVQGNSLDEIGARLECFHFRNLLNDWYRWLGFKVHI